MYKQQNNVSCYKPIDSCLLTLCTIFDFRPGINKALYYFILIRMWSVSVHAFHYSRPQQLLFGENHVSVMFFCRKRCKPTKIKSELADADLRRFLGRWVSYTYIHDVRGRIEEAWKCENSIRCPITPAPVCHIMFSLHVYDLTSILFRWRWWSYKYWLLPSHWPQFKTVFQHVQVWNNWISSRIIPAMFNELSEHLQTCSWQHKLLVALTRP